jgi:hypothetical protein
MSKLQPSLVRIPGIDQIRLVLHEVVSVHKELLVLTIDVDSQLHFTVVVGVKLFDGLALAHAVNHSNAEASAEEQQHSH